MNLYFTRKSLEISLFYEEDLDKKLNKVQQQQ